MSEFLLSSFEVWDTPRSAPSRKLVKHHGKLQKQEVSLSKPELLSRAEVSEDTIWITLAQAPQLRLTLQGKYLPMA